MVSSYPHDKLPHILCVFGAEYLGEMMDLCFSHRAEEMDHRYLDSGSGPDSSARTILTCTLPLSEIVTNFFNDLKSRSSGFASFESVLFLLLENTKTDCEALGNTAMRMAAIGRVISSRWSSS